MEMMAKLAKERLVDVKKKSTNKQMESKGKEEVLAVVQ